MNGFASAQWARDSAEPLEPSLASRIEECVEHLNRALAALEDATTGIDEPDTAILHDRVCGAFNVVEGLRDVAKDYLDV